MQLALLVNTVAEQSTSAPGVSVPPTFVRLREYRALAQISER